MRKKYIKPILIIISLLSLISTANNAAALTFPQGSPNHVFFASPVDDSFFRTQIFPHSNLPVGYILETRPAVSIFAPGAKVQQLAFISKDTFGKKIRATATLVVPPTFNEHSGILAYPAWNDSPGKQCSLGYSHGGLDKLTKRFSAPKSTFSEGLSELYGAAKLNDMAILIPDANGTEMAFTANILAAHITLDAIRAVKNYKDLGINFANRKVGVYGYSGGGVMSAWTAVLEHTYAPDLQKNIVGYIAGGTPVDFIDLAQKYDFFDAKPNSQFGIAVAMVIGLSREYPQFDLYRRLNKFGMNLLTSSRNLCFTEVEDVAKNMSGAKILKSTSRKALANMLAVVKQNSLSYYNGPLPVKPIHFWHADKDTEIAQPELVRTLVAKWKAAGVQTDYTGFTGDHVDLGIRLIPAPIDYFADKVRI